MEKQVILNEKHLELTLKRLSHELIESHLDFSQTVLVGLQPRGIHVVSRLKKYWSKFLDNLFCAEIWILPSFVMISEGENVHSYRVLQTLISVLKIKKWCLLMMFCIREERLDPD